MTGLAVLLGAVASAVLWMFTVAPMIARLFGVPLTVGLWRADRRNQHLTKPQFVWSFGVLTFGIGMFLFDTAWDFLDWRLLGDQASLGQLRLERIITHLLAALIFGLFFGLWAAPDKHAVRPS